MSRRFPDRVDFHVNGGLARRQTCQTLLTRPGGVADLVQLNAETFDDELIFHGAMSATGLHMDVSGPMMVAAAGVIAVRFAAFVGSASWTTP